jgi:uncharacterized protein (TIGR03032 family)
MPHSPRVHDGRLWVLNSGTGEIGMINLDAGRFEAVAFCPGYMRGLTFIGKYALVGLSEPRENRTFGGALQERLTKAKVEPRCGSSESTSSSSKSQFLICHESVHTRSYNFSGTFILSGVAARELSS